MKDVMLTSRKILLLPAASKAVLDKVGNDLKVKKIGKRS